MFAVVNIAGQQMKVSPAERVFVPLLPGKAGESVTFDKVLLVADEKDVKVGNPHLKNVKVAASIVGHVKDETVIVFKKKKRKGYRVRRGHRQQYTEIEITKIG